MENDTYRLAGKVNVPEGKKEELNRLVTGLLDKCGIRRTEKMEIAGREHTVTVPARPDEDGIIRFDRSIYEKWRWNTAEYDMHTCTLKVPDYYGTHEFAFVLVLIMTLLEIYTDGSCYLMRFDKPCPIDVYIVILDSLLGTDLRANSRGRMWDMYCFLHEQGYTELSFDDIGNVCPMGHANIDCDQMSALLFFFFMRDDPGRILEGASAIERKDIEGASLADREYYLLQTLEGLGTEQREDVRSFLSGLLDADLKARQKLAQREDAYGIIAELSLYLLPSYIVQIYACSEHADFWDIWRSLGIRGYGDLHRKAALAEPKPQEKKEYPLYRIYDRENEDEFLGSWGFGDINLSDEMRQQIKEWQEAYQDMDTADDVSMEELLSGILCELACYGNGRWADRGTVEEFLRHGDEPEYRKALMVLQAQMDAYTDLFPELTKRQAVSWMLRQYLDQSVLTSFGAYMALMGNREKRMELFGF